MTSLAQNLRLRVIAALMLLALRPCVILVSAEFLSSQHGRHARIEYIDDDLAIAHLAANRNSLLALGHAVRAITTALPPRIAFPSAPKYSGAVLERARRQITLLPVTSLCRAPPSLDA